MPKTDTRVRLSLLEAELAPMRGCDAFCRMCCSDVVPVSEADLELLVTHANANDIAPQESDPEMCPWYSAKEGRCSVYEARPTMCRVYGHVDHASLTCPKGYNSEPADTRVIYQAMADAGSPVRYIHEVLDAGMTDPTASTWRMRVQDHVWDGINLMREKAGLPALERKRSLEQERRNTP